ncbi:hypothetical protein [Kitasatospora sp. NE20-6]|uniref:hypothetical protein n=1 Tax=Kitasatospora sp. NE20-6 TaxID=2859066 RepID=UPI0038B3D890
MLVLPQHQHSAPPPAQVTSQPVQAKCRRRAGLAHGSVCTGGTATCSADRDGNDR